MSLVFECLTESRSALGESPLWDPRLSRVWWVDIEGRVVRAYDEADAREHAYPVPKRPAALGLDDDPGVLVLALEDGVYRWPWPGEPELIATVETELPMTRCNDGKVGPDGWLWLGTIDERRPREPIAALYRVSAAGEVQRVETGITISNGLSWSPDGRTLFHADTTPGHVYRYAFDPATGACTEQTRIATLGDAAGRPDGAACDSLGRYWSAGVSAACVNVLDRDGSVLESHAVPALAPTMTCFGGADLRTLYVTSLRDGRAEDELARYPETGALHRARVDTPGTAPWLFGSGQLVV